MQFFEVRCGKRDTSPLKGYIVKVESGRGEYEEGYLLASIGGHFTAKIQSLLLAAVALLNSLNGSISF